MMEIEQIFTNSDDFSSKNGLKHVELSLTTAASRLGHLLVWLHPAATSQAVFLYFVWTKREMRFKPTHHLVLALIPALTGRGGGGHGRKNVAGA